MDALFDEYLEEDVFLGDTVNIGADEYWNINDQERPGVQEYIRKMADNVKDHDKKVRMWGSTSQFSKIKIRQKHITILKLISGQIHGKMQRIELNRDIK